MRAYETLITALDLEADPGPLVVAAEVAALSLGCGLLDEARRGFVLLAKIAPHDPAGWLGLAEVERAEGNSEAALRAFHEAALCDRLDAKGRAIIELGRGDAEFRLGNLAAALEAWARAESFDTVGPIREAAQQRIATSRMARSER